MPSSTEYIVLTLIIGLGSYIIFSFEKKSSKKRKPKSDGGDKVMFCPKCKSTDIGLDSDVYKAAAEFGGKLYYKCNKCSYIAPTFPFLEKKAAEEL